MKIDKCRMCGSENIELFLDLGFHPPSDAFLKEEELDKHETYYPLRVFLCKDCGLSQLDYIVAGETLYDESYIYESSITKTGVEHFHNMAKHVCEKLNLQKDSLMVDVGSNVGVLLEGFKMKGMRVLGFEPVMHIAKKANDLGINTIPQFFNSHAAKMIGEKTVSVLTATNAFAHISKLEDFMKGLDILLKDDGVFIFEAPHFIDLVKNLEYDTIYHEHLTYLAVKPLVSFFAKHSMDVFDVEKQKIHGGSIRVYICRKGKYPISSKVQEIIKEEEETQIFSISHLKKFAKEVEIQRTELKNLLRDLKKQGKKIVAVSAPAKGNTLLNYCKIDTEILDYITEKAKIKVGRYSPGMHIPVVHDDQLLKDKPDYALLLAWNFADEIMKNLEEYRKAGGKFIIPIPKPRIV